PIAGSRVSEPRHQIRVLTTSDFILEQSDPEDNRFVFAYTITLENVGEVGARLLTRHWIITDAEGGVREVHGAGVAGETPQPAPGKCFRYRAGAGLTTPVGTLHGSYQWVDDNGVPFVAAIARFRLAVPGLLH